MGAWWCRPVINSITQKVEAGAWRVQENCVLHCQTLLHKTKVVCRRPADCKRKLFVKAELCLLCAQRELTQTTSPFLEETGAGFLTEEEPVTGTHEGRALAVIYIVSKRPFGRTMVNKLNFQAGRAQFHLAYNCLPSALVCVGSHI